jgi:hypothetical protein
MHATMTEHWPFERAGDIPYGCWICEDGTQILFDREYRPMWKRPGECQPATRADPNEWIDWVMMYSLHDDAPQPRHSKRLRYLLGLVVEEFITGGPLYVREWRKPIWGGVLVARAPIPIIRLVHDTDPEDNTS